MINLVDYKEKIKSGKMSNCYIFCGIDEELIKENINNLIHTIINKEFEDLNLVKFDGNTLENFDKVINACETLPFMSEKKVVEIYRANFLSNNCGKEVYNDFKKYIDNIPSTCILILYYVFKDKRDNISASKNKSIFALDKKCTIVKAEKLKGYELEKAVKQIFDSKNKKIGNVELRLFSSSVPSDMGIVENEVEKLCCYTMGRDITKQDIYDLYPKNNDDDIFDLVDLIGDKKIKQAIDTLNELIFKGSTSFEILYMIERQFKLIYNVKNLLNAKKTSFDISKEIRLPEFICKKIIGQSKKFTFNQLKNSLYACLETERILKSSSSHKKTEMEMLLVKTITF